MSPEMIAGTGVLRGIVAGVLLVAFVALWLWALQRQASPGNSTPPRVSRSRTTRMSALPPIGPPLTGRPAAGTPLPNKGPRNDLCRWDHSDDRRPGEYRRAHRAPGDIAPPSGRDRRQPVRPPATSGTRIFGAQQPVAALVVMALREHGGVWARLPGRVPGTGQLRRHGGLELAETVPGPERERRGGAHTHTRSLRASTRDGSRHQRGCVACRAQSLHEQLCNLSRLGRAWRTGLPEPHGQGLALGRQTRRHRANHRTRPHLCDARLVRSARRRFRCGGCPRVRPELVRPACAGR